jgi:superoxide reductase
MASKTQQVFRCGTCGATVEVLNGGIGTLVCCNIPMRHLEENTTDAAQEKHVPVLEKTDEGLKVTVGSVPHPMEDNHYIEWIELIADGKVCRRTLQPGDAPEAVFRCAGDEMTVRALCNLHGLWKAE